MLIYFKTRGNAQVIRSVLYEIGAEFQEIFIPYKGTIDQTIVEKYKLDLKNLPYFIHGDIVIFGIFPIIKYCCSHYQRFDLLGRNIEDSVRLTEILVKAVREKGQAMGVWFQGLRDIYNNNLGEQGILDFCRVMMQRAEKSKFFELVAGMFSKTNSYVFGYLTVLDFFLYERSFYFANSIMKNFPELSKILEYGKFFETTDFFIKYNEKLSIYKIFSPEADEVITFMLAKIWNGDPKYMTND